MKLRVLRKHEPVREVRGAEGCRWLFADRDFWAEENSPILITGGSEEERTRFLNQDLAGSVPPAGAVVVLFSPEGSGNILSALGEAMRALFPELELDSSPGDALLGWGMAVDRATRRNPVDGKRRLLLVDGFETIWEAPEGDRALFAELLRCVARQRSMAVAISVPEERLIGCGKWPGYQHAFADPGDLVPIACRRHGDGPAFEIVPQRAASPGLPGGGAVELGRVLAVLCDWRVWAPLAGVAGIVYLLSFLFRPAVGSSEGPCEVVRHERAEILTGAKNKEFPELISVKGLAPETGAKPVEGGVRHR